MMCVFSGTVPVLVSESRILMNKVCAELKIMLFYQHLAATVRRQKSTSALCTDGCLLLLVFAGKRGTTGSSGVSSVKFWPIKG